MGSNRKTARFFEGAHISMEGVDLSKFRANLDELDTSDIAILVGRFMFENSTDSFFVGGVKYAVEKLFDYKDPPNQAQLNIIIKRLRAEGFIPMRKEGKNGWQVPGTWDWKPDEKARTKLTVRAENEVDAQVRKGKELAGDVTVSYRCTECPNQYPSVELMMKHKEEVHRKTSCDVCGFTDPNRRRLAAHISTHAKQFHNELLEVVRKNPNQQPGDYARMLGWNRRRVYSIAMKMSRDGLLDISKGHSPMARYNLTNTATGPGGTFTCTYCSKTWPTKGAASAHRRQKHSKQIRRDAIALVEVAPGHPAAWYDDHGWHGVSHLLGRLVREGRLRREGGPKGGLYPVKRTGGTPKPSEPVATPVVAAPTVKAAGVRWVTITDEDGNQQQYLIVNGKFFKETEAPV